jgi:hypothetical protein
VLQVPFGTQPRGVLDHIRQGGMTSGRDCSSMQMVGVNGMGRQSEFARVFGDAAALGYAAERRVVETDALAKRSSALNMEQEPGFSNPLPDLPTIGQQPDVQLDGSATTRMIVTAGACAVSGGGRVAGGISDIRDRNLGVKQLAAYHQVRQPLLMVLPSLRRSHSN